MTHSRNQKTSSTMMSIIDKLYDTNSDDFKQLSYIFSRLNLVQDTPAIYLILTALASLLKQGEYIGFPPERDRLENQTISKTWRNWSSALTKAVTKYEDTTPKKNYQKFEFTPTNSEIINTLLLADATEHADRNSSHIESLKLILLALVMLPKKNDSGINIDKVAKSFKQRIVAMPFIETLNLNFKAGASIGSIINQCELLSKTLYAKRTALHTFLILLRGSLIVIQGFNLGAIKRSRGSKQRSIFDNKSKTSDKPNSVRLTPFHDPNDSGGAPYIGDIVEIATEEGEESFWGVIEPPFSETDNDEASDESSSAVTQIKSKYWIQTFNESIPWNSQGINPFAQEILIEWIKDNDSLASLILGLMISTGRRYEDVINMVVGEHSGANITINGQYIRYIEPPESSITPSTEQKALLKTNTQTIYLSLPKMIRSRFIKRCNKCINGQLLMDGLGTDVQLLKKEIQSIIKKLIRKGGNGLAIDRIAITLNKKIAMVTGDDFLAYVLTSRENNTPPVSAYYAAYSLNDIESIYRKVIEDIFK